MPPQPEEGVPLPRYGATRGVAYWSDGRDARIISTMGKYLVGWLLGVPVFVLVILYFFFH